MCQRELAKKEEEDERDYWFNHFRPMTKLKQTWQEKWLAKEENGSSGSGEEEVEVTSAKGDSNSGLGSGNPESGNRNPGGKEDRRENEPTRMDVYMVLMIPAEFCAPTENVTELALGVERVVFVKSKNPGRAHEAPIHPGTSKWNAGRTHPRGWRHKRQLLAVVAVQEARPH
jgi:hypothetical protein